MSTIDAHFTPQQPAWGDAAYDEVQIAFPGKLRSREVALCVWCYASQPGITEAEIEAIAQSDAVIMEHRVNKKISSQGQRRAKSLLGIETQAGEEIDPSLPAAEREFLAELRAASIVVSEYRKAAARLLKADAAFEKARAELHGIKPEGARLLAEFDSKSRPILAAEGLLTAGAVVTEAPVVEALAADVSVAETPVAETPVAETPIAETPIAETPIAEAPVAPKTTPPKPAVTQPPMVTPQSPASDTTGLIYVDPNRDVTEVEDTADRATDMAKRRVAHTTTSFLADDDLVLCDEEDDFHAKMDDCTNDMEVHWPTEKEPTINVDSDPKLASVLRDMKDSD